MDHGQSMARPEEHGLPPNVRRVHFVGVGGVGMSGIAVMMSALGYEVTGSDLAASGVTTGLQERGVERRCRSRAVHVRGQRSLLWSFLR